MSSPPKHLNVGVVLFPKALPLDFVGPTTLFFTLDKEGPLSTSSSPPSHTLKTIYLGPTLDPIELCGGMYLTPNKTFEQALQAKGEDKLDVILVPGGRGARVGPGNVDARRFMTEIIPKVEHVLTVCTGSWLLATTGCLRGEKATTNKLVFTECKEATSDNGVEWIPKARYVHSNKFWTASGVTAGMDMACAWIESLVGSKDIERVRAWAEYTAAGEDDDPWAAKYGL